MKKAVKLIGIIALVALIGFSMAVALASCDGGEGNNNGWSGPVPDELRGTLIRISNIPDYANFVFSSNSFTHKYDNDRFTIRNINSVTVAEPTTGLTGFTSAYRITGTASNSNVSRVVNGTEYTYTIFFNDNKTRLQVRGQGVNSNLDYRK